MERRNEIVEISLEFALLIISYTEILETHKKYVIGKQLLKSGTSIGANIREAQSAESRADFVHKLKISHKEAEETAYWLLLCEKSESYPSPQKELKGKLLSIQKLLSKIISTSKKSQS